MKKYSFIIAAASLALFSSCQALQEDVIKPSLESEIIVPEKPGIPMTVTASLGGGTKATYALDGGLLKTTWDASETISVITYRSSAIYSVDNFTYSGAAGVSSAEFSGTFTGGEIGAFDDVWLVYPAITEDYDTSYHGSAASSVNGFRTVYYQDGDYLNYLHFGHMNVAWEQHIIQSANGDFSHIAEACAIMGPATMEGNAISGSLTPVIALLKLNLVLPIGFQSTDMFTYFEIQCTNSSDSNKNIFYDDAKYYLGSNEGMSGNSRNYQKLDFGDYGGGYNPGGLQVTGGDRTLVAYVPIVPGSTGMVSGDKLKFILHDETTADDYTATKTLGADFKFVAGKQYNMTINLASSAAPAPPAATNLSPSNQTANCYVIASDDSATYNFKNCKGTDYNWLNSTAVSAEVLWESQPSGLVAPSVGDIIASATLYDDGYVYIEATGARGNALVAVKDDSDNILWSWHIWCTGASFDPRTDYMFDGEDNVMRVNLGAFSYDVTNYTNDIGRDEPVGLLYQYGRKDPFRGINNLYADNDPLQLRTTNEANWNYVECTAETGTVAYAHAHPMTFINPNNNNYDWIYATGYTMGATDRWSSSNDDPCPYGWGIMDTAPYANDSMNAYTYLDKELGVLFDFPYPADPVDVLAFPYAGCILENGIPVQKYDYRGYGLNDYFRYAGFYWSSIGGNPTTRKYLRIEDRIGYNDVSGMTSVYDAGTPTATAMKTYNLDDLYTWSPTIGCATAMSVRCVKK